MVIWRKTMIVNLIAFSLAIALAYALIKVSTYILYRDDDKDDTDNS